LRAAPAIVFAASILCACAAELHPARRVPSEPASARENESRALVAAADCSGFGWGLLPGLHQLCLGRAAEGSTLLAVGAAELAVGTSVAIDKNVEHPGAAIPLIASGDLLLYSVADYAFDVQRAGGLALVPQDDFFELIAAPFDLDVLASLDVLGGIAVAVALELGLSYATGDDAFKSTRFGADPNLFGRALDRRIGYPIAGAIGVGTFTQVAIAEESFFRGVLQSGLARNHGETEGWIFGSLLFGAAHLPNALFVNASERVTYLALGVPFITALGSYLGLAYRWHDYSLLAPVAVHFWYDLLISAVAFLLHPESSPLSARIALPL
jgi:membrane protease YdiL (CAAX protease family)